MKKTILSKHYLLVRRGGGASMSLTSNHRHPNVFCSKCTPQLVISTNSIGNYRKILLSHHIPAIDSSFIIYFDLFFLFPVPPQSELEMGRRHLDKSCYFKQSSKHEIQQLCNVNSPISLNKGFIKLQLKFFAFQQHPNTYILL